MTPERLDDWAALCAWLEDQPYNASYDPKCRGAYLLTGLYSPQKEVLQRGEDGRYRWVPNPDIEKGRALARHCREIVKERRRLQLVYWSTGMGWRLRKDYREKLDAERALLEETQSEQSPRVSSHHAQ